jgi:hypothetical protein
MRKILLRLLGTLVVLTGCGAPVPQGQFGPYQPPFKRLVLPDGEQLVVYRVQYWTFASGDPPALQLEYEAPFSVSDHAQVQQLARRIWPLFLPYVEGMHLRTAFITATNLERHSLAWFMTSHARSFGIVAAEDAAGTWHFEKDTIPLPRPEPAQALGIIDIDDRPMPIPGPVASPRASAPPN